MRFELAVMLFAALVGPLAGLASEPSRAFGPWVVVVPPWRAAEQVVEAAQARLIGPVDAPMGVLVAAQNEGAPNRLKAAGAWLVIDATLALGLCGEEEQL